MDLNNNLDELINNHLDPAKYLLSEVVERTANLFLSFENEFISIINGETFYKLPYKQITVAIFNCNQSEIKSNTFDSFCTTVTEVLAEISVQNNMSPHVLDCYDKFTHHIALAFIQKGFILKSAIEADKLANNARNIASIANTAAAEAEKASAIAQKSATKAQDLALRAEQLAIDADTQAKSTIANYISILGIFASIIFTLFGGVNIIGSTVKLLEVNSKWPYLTFVISLLMICLMTLLNMMIKWVNSVSNLRYSLGRKQRNSSGADQVQTTSFKLCKPCTWNLDFYSKSVLFFSVILLLSLVGMYMVKKENHYSYTKEKIVKDLPVKEEKPGTDHKILDKKPTAQSIKPVAHQVIPVQDKEITVSEKITVSNHLKEEKSEKEKSED
ncbi:hypothetical protein [Acinetobacter chinensis]|uniref:hypothetical protein n=1 Tax=Acinetobacter chinensis TaxID=2004650 RepID=UPI00293484EF|nr:hypothetical protein [Acinetobacter chinensis]WOE40081.1 hypothetical protein QSG87_09160 [Acinetobacter chinensis]